MRPLGFSTFDLGLHQYDGKNSRHPARAIFRDEQDQCGEGQQVVNGLDSPDLALFYLGLSSQWGSCS
jgi:hypothetical protein